MTVRPGSFACTIYDALFDVSVTCETNVFMLVEHDRSDDDNAAARRRNISSATGVGVRSSAAGMDSQYALRTDEQ